MSDHTVAVVLDESYGELVDALAAQQHVWLVESPINRAAAERYWAADNRGDDGLETGITTFARAADVSAEEAFLTILESVEDHHGEYGHEPPLDELVVYGVPLTEELACQLRELDWAEVERQHDRFVCRR